MHMHGHMHGHIRPAPVVSRRLRAVHVQVLQGSESCSRSSSNSAVHAM